MQAGINGMFSIRQNLQDFGQQSRRGQARARIDSLSRIPSGLVGRCTDASFTALQRRLHASERLQCGWRKSFANARAEAVAPASGLGNITILQPTFTRLSSRTPILSLHPVPVRMPFRRLQRNVTSCTIAKQHLSGKPAPSHLPCPLVAPVVVRA